MTNEQRKLSDKAVSDLENEIYNGTEEGHINGDEILCNLLKDLGFEKVVNAWEQLHKWYA